MDAATIRYAVLPTARSCSTGRSRCRRCSTCWSSAAGRSAPPPPSGPRSWGSRALVIDYDDLMKRIRDYAKDKLILPTTAAATDAVPQGRARCSTPCSFAPIDKDEMCEQWKALYRRALGAGAGRRRDDRARARRRPLAAWWPGTTTPRPSRSFMARARRAGVRTRRAAPARHSRQTSRASPSA